MTFKMLLPAWRRLYRYEAMVRLHQADLPAQDALLFWGWYIKTLDMSRAVHNFNQVGILCKIPGDVIWQ
jgi:hypothetical protein